METKKENNKFIFTDSYRTKDILWEAYSGFVDNYHNYKMLQNLGRIDPINLASMNKYAQYFYDEIEDYIDDFKDDTMNSYEIKKIFEQKEISLDDWTTVRKFFAKFMKISGIKNIVKEKDDPSLSVEGNR